MASGEVDAIATAHTLDDQAETVLAKFLRGAWTEGLAGIAPRLETPEGGGILRPLLAATHAEIEAYLRELGQDWREDSSNRNLTFTRNRIRHELLPLLEGWNPRLREHMAQMAALARDEEAWWQTKLAPVAAATLLPGRPVRGGGRAAGSGLDSGLAIEVSRLAALAPALQRRLIRYAADKVRRRARFFRDRIRAIACARRPGRPEAGSAARPARRENGPRAAAVDSPRTNSRKVKGGRPRRPMRRQFPAKSMRPLSGCGSASNFATRFATPRRPVEPRTAAARRQRRPLCATGKPGDRVRLRYSSGLRKVKEVLERHAGYGDRSHTLAGPRDRRRKSSGCGVWSWNLIRTWSFRLNSQFAQGTESRPLRPPQETVNAQYPAPFVLWLALQLSPAPEYNRDTASQAARLACL